MIKSKRIKTSTIKISKQQTIKTAITSITTTTQQTKIIITTKNQRKQQQRQQ